jgi:diguanylate cyclase (GGDEF)-like protein
MWVAAGSTDEARDEAWLKTALDATGDLAYLWDLATDRIAWLGPVEEVFGPTRPGTADAFAQLLNPRDMPARMTALSEHLSTGRAFECDYRIEAPGRGTIWVHDRGRAQTGPAGAPVALVGTLRRVTALKLRQEALEHSLDYDTLTGRLSRLRLADAVERSLEWAERTGGGGGVLAIGVDRMSMVNSAFGSETGDAILIGVARRIEDCLTTREMLGRLGADRFGVVLPRCDEAETAEIASAVLAAVRSEPIATPSGALHATVSIGGATFPEGSNTAAEVIARAESALHEAKQAGRDRYAAYRQTTQQRDRRRQALGLGERMRRAIREDRLTLAFQPVVRARTGALAHYECLLRLLTPEGEPVSASQFMPTIEEMGLSRVIDLHVLDLALRELERAPSVKLAINISGHTAGDRGWVEMLATHLDGRTELARRLIIEITETAALKDIAETARLVSGVRELGCKVALDDFGAGYTSFRQLQELTVDAVKIDGSFIRDIHEREDAQKIVLNLLAISESFGLETVAECVETPAEARFLAEAGVPYLQGYLFGRPSIERPWADEQMLVALPTPALTIATGRAALA